MLVQRERAVHVDVLQPRFCTDPAADNSMAMLNGSEIGHGRIIRTSKDSDRQKQPTQCRVFL